jgi:hypothetical protein
VKSAFAGNRSEIKGFKVPSRTTRARKRGAHDGPNQRLHVMSRRLCGEQYGVYRAITNLHYGQAFPHLCSTRFDTLITSEMRAFECSGREQRGNERTICKIDLNADWRPFPAQTPLAPRPARPDADLFQSSQQVGCVRDTIPASPPSASEDPPGNADEPGSLASRLF